MPNWWPRSLAKSRRRPAVFFFGTAPDPQPAPPPESLTAEQVRYAVSQWLQALRLGPHAARILLADAAATIRYQRQHNTAARRDHTKTKRRELLRLGIDVDQIRSCLGSNFALYC